MKFRRFSLVLLPAYTVAFHERKNNGTGKYTGSPCALICQSSRADAATSFYCNVKITALSWTLAEVSGKLFLQLMPNWPMIA
jgi:hypothetical protein